MKLPASGDSQLPLSASEIADVLAYVPSRPGYDVWVRVVSAVGSALPAGEAAEVLKAWSPEEAPGEYARKLRSPLARVGIGTLIAMAKAHGFDASSFTRGRASPATTQGPFRPTRSADSSTPASAGRKPHYSTRLGSAAELDLLAKLRRFASAAGLDAMQAAGCLAFSDDLRDQDADGQWHAVRSWIVTDPTRRNISARRLDGRPWRCIGGGKSRCLSGPGSKSWPVGMPLVHPGQNLDVAEGEGDFLCLWHLHALAGAKGAAPVGLLGSCTNFGVYGRLITPFVAGRVVQIFTHLDATGTGQGAARKWAEVFYHLGAKTVRQRNLAPWLDIAGKDLNDVVAAHTARREATALATLCPACLARNIIAPTGGPTCQCVPYAWPNFSVSQINSDASNPCL